MKFARSAPLALTLAAAGCVSVGHPNCLRWHDYLSAPVSDQTLARVAALGLKDQYAVHVCVSRFAEHPLPGAYSATIARRGASAVLFLRKKLMSARDAGEVYDVADVLLEMQSSGAYDVAADAPLMNTLDQALARVPADEWKTRAINAAEEIRGHAAAAAPR